MVVLGPSLIGDRTVVIVGLNLRALSTRNQDREKIYAIKKGDPDKGLILKALLAKANLLHMACDRAARNCHLLSFCFLEVGPCAFQIQTVGLAL